VKYMLLIYNNADAMAALSEEDRNEVFADVGRLMDEMTEAGEYLGGAALAHPSNTTVVSVRDGVTTATDGPYAEAKEQLAGYFVVEVDSAERATEIAAGWPDARRWRMEVRPVMHYDATDV
jgi:hypothetical protein